jgi:hypothetical protein
MDSDGEDPPSDDEAEQSTAASTPATQKNAGVPGRRRRKVGVEPAAQTQVKYRRIVVYFLCMCNPLQSHAFTLARHRHCHSALLLINFCATAVYL